MNTKLIALAIAGLAALPALAQSNVTIYGLVDMGYKWSGNNIDKALGSGLSFAHFPPVGGFVM